MSHRARRGVVVLATAAFGLLAAEPADMTPPRLLLIVTVDTLRADRLGAYGSPLGLSPRLDQLAAESQVFTAAYTPAPLTLPAMTAFMTSRYPHELGVTHNNSSVPMRAPRLARWMLGHGWHTAAVVSNYILRRGVGMTRGFEWYDDRMLEREANRGTPDRTARPTTRAALSALSRYVESDRPLLLWVHYQDPHGPYTPPVAARARTLERERQAPDGLRVLPLSPHQGGAGALPRYQYVEDQLQVAFYRAGYNGEVAEVDGAIGDLFDGLRRRGLWERTVVVFASDHGESLGEADYWFAHGDRLSEPLVRVPLLVRVPGRPPARFHDVVSHLDVFPTLAGLAGVPGPARARGRDLFGPGLRPAPVYLSTLESTGTVRDGVIADGFRYVSWSEAGRVHEELYPLATGATARRSEAEALPRLRRHLAGAKLLPRVPGQRQRLTPADVEALRALGYVAGN